MSYSILTFLFLLTAILCWLYFAVSSSLSPLMVLVTASTLHLCVIIAIWVEGKNALRGYRDKEISYCLLGDLEKDINDIRCHLQLDKANKSLSLYSQMHTREVCASETDSDGIIRKAG